MMRDNSPTLLSGRIQPIAFWLSPLVVVGLLIGFLALFPLLTPTSTWFLSYLFMWIALASAWSSFTAHTGYWHFGNVVFWGLGAYASGLIGAIGALLFPEMAGISLGLYQSLPPAMFLGAGLAVAMGLITIRLKRPAFALFTLVIAWFTHELLQNVAMASGVTPVPLRDTYTALLAFATLSLLFHMWLYRTQWGATLMLIRDDEILAASHGVNVNALRIGVFAISGSLTAAVGCTMAFATGFTSPDLAVSAVIVPFTLAAALIGGFRHPWGAVLGAIVSASLSFTVSDLQLQAFIAISVAFLSARYLPEGVMGWLHHALKWPSQRTLSMAYAGVSSNRGMPEREYIDVQAAPHRSDVQPALVIRDMNYRVGALQVLTSIDLLVRRGEVVGLVGPAGSGKTAIIDCINGFKRPQSAEVFLYGEDVTHLSPWLTNRYGLTRTFDPVRLFLSLSVLENMIVVRNWRGLSFWNWFRGFPLSITEEALHILRLIKLDALMHQPVESLSAEQQRLLTLGMMMMSRPHIVLIDEITAGMSDAFCNDLAVLLRRLRLEYGMAFLITDSEYRFVSQVCDHIYVLHAGRIVAAGTVDVVSSQNPSVW